MSNRSDEDWAIIVMSLLVTDSMLPVSRIPAETKAKLSERIKLIIEDINAERRNRK